MEVEDEKTFWDIYNIIREIEYTFSVLKTDLDLRPYTIRPMMLQWHILTWDYWLIGWYQLYDIS